MLTREQLAAGRMLQYGQSVAGAREEVMVPSAMSDSVLDTVKTDLRWWVE